MNVSTKSHTTFTMLWIHTDEEKLFFFYRLLVEFKICDEKTIKPFNWSIGVVVLGSSSAKCILYS